MELLQGLVITVASTLLVLGVVVFVHEYGHFRVGRWCGVAVKSFSIGLGPEWFGWTDKYGTRWKVSKVPLGGFVSWVDDTDGSSTMPATDEHNGLSEEEARRRGHFRAMPVWRRAAIVAAGPLTNFVFAIFAFALLAFVVGRDIASVDEVQPGSPAAAAGLQAGDVIVAADGERMRDFRALQGVISAAPGRTLTLTVRRGGTELPLQVTPRPHDSNPEIGVIGVGHTSSFANRAPIGPIEAIGQGAADTWGLVAQTGGYVGAIITGRESGDQIAGPLGIMNVSGQVASNALQAPEATLWQKAMLLALSLLRLAAILSVAVGIFNLLPIPILDGGHLLFYGIEALRGGKPLPPSAQEWAYRAGFAVMASLFLFATWNDITRLFPGAQ